MRKAISPYQSTPQSPPSLLPETWPVLASSHISQRHRSTASLLRRCRSLAADLRPLTPPRRPHPASPPRTWLPPHWEPQPPSLTRPLRPPRARRGVWHVLRADPLPRTSSSGVLGDGPSFSLAAAAAQRRRGSASEICCKAHLTFDDTKHINLRWLKRTGRGHMREYRSLNQPKANEISRIVPCCLLVKGFDLQMIEQVTSDQQKKSEHKNLIQ